jgi:hypothetical protein
MTVQTLSMHWNNIDPAIIDGQRRVFESLGLPLRQVNADRVRHGPWMNSVLEDLGAGDTVLIFDIDAFPLNSAIVERALAVADAGGVFGLAQTANHRPTRDQIYAGPMCLAVSIATWQALGRPDMKSSDRLDAGQALSVAAMAAGRPIELLYPTNCISPRWPLANRGVFGIGTFYGDNEVFHLFESREQRNLELFQAVVDDVVAQAPLRFGRYLEIAGGATPATPRPKGLRRWFGG